MVDLAIQEIAADHSRVVCNVERIGDCGPVKCVLCGDSGHKAAENNKCSRWRKEININKIFTLKKMSRREVLKSFNMRGNSFDILSDNEIFQS